MRKLPLLWIFILAGNALFSARRRCGRPHRRDRQRPRDPAERLGRCRPLRSVRRRPPARTGSPTRTAAARSIASSTRNCCANRHRVPSLPNRPPKKCSNASWNFRSSTTATTSSAWQAVLARYGLAQKQARNLASPRHLGACIRWKPDSVHRSDPTPDHRVVLPRRLSSRIAQAGAQDVPLAQVSGKIREILTEQKVNELFSSWLQSLRSESKISTSCIRPPLRPRRPGFVTEADAEARAPQVVEISPASFLLLGCWPWAVQPGT